MAPDSLDRSSEAIDYVARAREVAVKAAALSDEIERQRRLPPALLDALHGAGLFRLLLPRAFGGAETDPLTFFKVIEAVAKADASTAWCLGQASGCSMAAAYLDPAVARAVFGDDPRAVLAWGPGPKVRAVQVEGGYRVTGEWSFASGGRHATWLGAHCPIFTPDGAPLRDAAGRGVERTMLVPASEVVWTDIWKVVGLRGTASDAFALTDHFVRADHSITRDFEKECRETGPLYRMSALALYEIAFAGVSLGIARACLDQFIEVSRTKVPRGLKYAIRDNAVVQAGAARADIGVRSARLYLTKTFRAIWDEVRQPGARFTLDQRIALRGASTHAIHQSREAVDFAYNAAGATAIFESHPLERRFRDMHTVTQQLQGRAQHFESVGAHMLGSAPDLTFV
ncbi:MAG: acyl-CoA dehydrogenase family protein [Rhodospirillales bacterium]|nr:MAG: acyl-CoA dehydrogenase family protein [Rhodospirillales bacterium]